MYLVAEYCRGPFYMGWHLYLRENRAMKRNQDGSWGWIRRVRGIYGDPDHPVKFFLSSIGITIRGDGTCDDDGIAEFATQYPIEGRRAGGKLRGCIGVDVDEFGKIKMTKGEGRVRDGENKIY
ncbi:MAG TPA: hypothetical protein ENI07_13355 [Desulfobacterales bacterium]|nr:hypothetical protein [Desulfobacterales bacterium]